MRFTTRSMVVLLGVLLSSSNCCFAQAIPGDGIQSQGEVILERKAEFMRMNVNLSAKGKNLTDAVAKLKARQTKVEQQLITLGATKDSLKFGEIRIDQSQNDRRKQMEKMVLQRMTQKRGKPAKGKAAALPVIPVDLLMKLTVDWPLNAADGAELLITTHKLQEAIKTAEFVSPKDAEESSEEEAELAEEMENSGMSFGNPEEQKPGEPAFIFVTKISAADRQKAMKEAFISARTEALQLAQAAELEIGPLRSISLNSALDSVDPQDYQQLYSSGLGSFTRQQLGGNDHSNEAIGVSPGLLKYKVVVNITYAIK